MDFRNWLSRVAAIAALFAVAPGQAQTRCVDVPHLSAAPRECRVPVRPSAGLPNYRRWDDGSPAIGSAPPPAADFPMFFRGYNSAYGFGR